MDYKKLKRYPRYTSYPIYPFWNKKVTQAHIIGEVRKEEKDVDMYIHIPFCAKPCFYCACNKIVSRQGNKELEYVEYLLREWQMYLSLNPNLSIRSIHLGGGTPTFLSAELLEKLFKGILADKTCSISVEVDPRITNEDQIKVFKTWGAQRFSMGIQDFSDDVQKVINRKQSSSLVNELVQKLRSYDIEEINFDLIYGLPAQSYQTIDDTLNQVREIDPDTISLFSYAHLPSSYPLQKRMEKDMHLSREEKDQMYHYYKEKLYEAGYEQIGLDHFAKKGSFLYQAYQEHKIVRNFMGYTTQKTSDILGLGVSSISSLGNFFYQNEKEIPSYYQAINEGKFPITVGHINSSHDLIVAELVEEIMCYKKASISEYLGILTPKRREFFLRGMKGIFEKEGIARLEGKSIFLEKNQELSLRRLCHFLDIYFDHEEFISSEI